ncbi:chromatin structure-remodeling complex protein SYD isoform X2 [Prunus yedoensis var. nudiflora]|uniref:Chromatin structure-remodeling complex protein SYD isoform X2 n=1 Tax=Prunus yedoensis var. nudiflora TaxID=2094558 RepID=A0A314ZHP3_PRUYE|nr:chromatin structure-remodeling complex protein SYD isoform X2 [Prunus yedoensis var. nudiflora]
MNVSRVGCYPSEKVSDTSLPASSLLKVGEIDDSSDRGQVDSYVAQENPKRDRSEILESSSLVEEEPKIILRVHLRRGQVAARYYWKIQKVCESLQENVVSEGMDPPSSSLVTGEGTTEEISKKNQVYRLYLRRNQKFLELKEMLELILTEEGKIGDSLGKCLLGSPVQMKEEDKIDGISMKRLGGNSDLLGESQGSDAEMDVSQARGFLTETESVIVPSSSAAVKEGKIECSSERGPVNRSIVLGETSEDLEKTECSSEKDQDGSSVQLDEPNGKDDEMDHQMETPRYSGDLPDCIVSESVDSEEKIHGLSEKDPVSSLAPQVESKVSEPEMGDHLDASKVGVILLEEAISENVDLPASSIKTEGKEVVGPSEGKVGCSVMEGSKTPVAEMVPQVNASDACERLPVTLAIGGDSVEGLSDARPIDSSKSLEESKSEAKIVDASELPVTWAIRGDSVEGLSEAGPMDSSESLEESKCEAKVGDASQVAGTMQENVSENLDQSEAPLTMGGDSVEALPEAGLRAAHQSQNVKQKLVMLPRAAGSSKLPELESETKVGDDSQVCAPMPETVPKAKVGDDVEGLSEAGPAGSSKLPELESETKVGDDSQVCAPMPETVPEAKVGDDVEGLSEAGPAGSSESPELESEAKVGDDSQVCTSMPETVPDNPDQPLVNLVVEDDHVECSSEAEPVGSSKSPEEVESEDKVGDASRGCVAMPENMSESMDQPPVILAMGGDSIEALSEAGPVSSSKSPEESETEAKAGDASQVCGTMPENESENMDFEPSSTAQEGETVVSSSEKPGGSSMAQPEVE